MSTLMVVTCDRNYRIQKNEVIAVIIDDNAYILKIIAARKSYKKSRWKKLISRRIEFYWKKDLLWECIWGPEY